MKTALTDFALQKRGIYGILHVIILLLSLFLVISISVDTFKGIPFYTQSLYMKVQLWICILFLFDFILELFLSKDKLRYFGTHFLFLLVAIPYQNIIAYMGWTFFAGDYLHAPVHSLGAGRICNGNRSGMADV